MRTLLIWSTLKIFTHYASAGLVLLGVYHAHNNTGIALALVFVANMISDYMMRRQWETTIIKALNEKKDEDEDELPWN